MFAIVLSFAAQVCVFSFSSKQSFAGVVYGANGPIAGAFVSASGENGSGFGVTDSSGHYSMSEGLKTGTYNVSVLAFGYLTSETGGVQVTAGQTTSGINFDLQLSGGVSGTVTDAVSGSPLSDISVTAFSTGGGGSFGFYATTGSDGKYVMATNLPTGSYNVSILFPEGHISLSYAANVTTGFETKNVNFALARSGIISGRITEPGGAALADVTVGAVSGGGYFGYATTNATGHYRMVSGLGTGSYTVTAYSGLNFNFTTVSVTAGQETSGVDLELAVTPPTPSGIITGQVTDISTGKPIPDATVAATDSEGYGSADTDANGNYVISSGLGTGTYNVTASAPGYQDKTTTGVSVTVNLVTSNVNFQMSKIPPAQSGTITGTVTGAPNPIPEFQYPIAVALSLTLVAVAAGKLLLRTKRLENARSLN
jgi:hypothetical protein